MSVRLQKVLCRAGLAIAALVVAAFAALLLVWRTLPSIEPPFDLAPRPSNLVVDRNGALLYEAMDPDSGAQVTASLEDIPLYLQQAAIATEDASFYANPGFDVRGLLRAAWLNLRSRRVVSGGSTITQQVARNLLLQADERNQQTLLRKLREVLLAVRLTQRYDKDEILGLYLNTSAYGNMAFGVDAAARRYFDRPVAQLNLAQCALLAGLVQAPTLYDPLLHPDAARVRQQIVLDLMTSAGYISPEQAASAGAQSLVFGGGRYDITAPHFTLEVLEQVSVLLPEDMARGGLLIETTLDADLQARTEEIVAQHLAALNRTSTESVGHNVRNAAVVVLSVPEGEILAMVGSPDYFDAAIAGAVNGARALRQPGSAIKPLTYAAAFERGYSPASVICDVPVSFETAEGGLYTPRNYDLDFHGPTPLRTALACSYNVVAVRLLDQIGVEALAQMAHRLGIESIQDARQAGLALTLGSAEVTLVDLAEAYGVFASNGQAVESHAIAGVFDGAGTTLYTAPDAVRPWILSPEVTSLVTDVLADDGARRPAFGATSPLNTPFAAAVKTGTTTDFRDNWAVGYTTEYVVGVWVGNADNSPMRQISGVDGAAPIWHDVMLAAQRHVPEPFEVASSLARVSVCPDSGLLPGLACPHTVVELFGPGNAPTATCTMHRFVEVDAATGLLADAATPPGRVVARRVTMWPAEAQAWAAERGLSSPLAAAALVENETVELAIAYPADGSVYCISSDVPPGDQRLQIQVVAAAGPAVELYGDGELLATWAARPCLASWQLLPGEHEFYVTNGELDDRVTITVHETCTGERIAR